MRVAFLVGLAGREALGEKQFWAGKMFTNLIWKIGSPGDIAPVQDLQVLMP